MMHLTNVAYKWPMLRVTFGVILTFCCAMPLVWLFSNLFVDSLRTFGH
jgi:heme/copper-type cytochrome/quinol oxidase subunit 4